MVKLTKAELERRKEDAINRQFDRYLELLGNARDRNDSYGEMQWLKAIHSFKLGCTLADGRRWDYRLTKRYEKWSIINKDRWLKMWMEKE